MARRRKSFNCETFLRKTCTGMTILSSLKKEVLLVQGNATDAVFHIQAARRK